MVDRESTDRQALGILSDTVSEELGPTSKVAKEVRRAYTSGRQIDRFMARAAFDALPGWQRSSIGTKATERAQDVAVHHPEGDARPVPGSTERDWREMERSTSVRWPTGRGGKTKSREGLRGERVVVQSPPRFLTRDD